MNTTKTRLRGSPFPWRKLAGFLGLQRNIVLLLMTMVLAATGERFWLGFAPKYLETLGAGVLIIGMFDALQTFLGAVYAYPGGWLTDRLGQRRSLLVFSTLSLAGYTLVLLWNHWIALLLGSFLFLAWSSLSLPATFSIVATSLDQRQHTMGVGVQSMVRRIPMMLGPLIGGWLITRFGWEWGVRFALLGCIGLNAIVAGFQWLMVDPRQSAPASHSIKPQNIVSVVRSFSPTLRELLVSDILIRFCERMPYAFVILWAMNHGGVSPKEFGWLVSIEMATAMLCYIPAAHWADKHGQRPFVLMTFIFFSLFPLTLLWADGFAWLAVAFAVRGLKEFGEPARKSLIIAQASPDLRSRTYGAYYLIRDCVVTLGSFLGAWLWSISPTTNFISSALMGAAGTVWFWARVYGKKPNLNLSVATLQS